MSVDIPEGDARGVSLAAIRRTGDSLHIIDSLGKETICLPTTANRWVPTNQEIWVVRGTDYSPDSPDQDPLAPNDPDTPGDSTIGSKLIAWHKARLGLFNYLQSNPGRLNPDKSGYTDCSGIQYACYKSVMGINIGTYSGGQATASIGSTVTTSRSAIRDGTGMVRGDLIFYAMAGKTWSHVEMYMGSQKVVGISNVHTDGSRIQDLSLQVNYFTGKLKVKRYF